MGGLRKATTNRNFGRTGAMKRGKKTTIAIAFTGMLLEFAGIMHMQPLAPHGSHYTGTPSVEFGVHGTTCHLNVWYDSTSYSLADCRQTAAIMVERPRARGRYPLGSVKPFPAVTM